MINSDSPKAKKHHSKDESNSGNNLSATIAKSEAYSKRSQNKQNQSKVEDYK
jgi:hypothetical protein